MNTNELREVLRQLHFLNEIEEEFLQELAEMAQLVDLPAGKTIFREGQTMADIYLIVVGSVSLEICAPGVGCKRILTVADGDLLGISPVIEQTPSTATARTLTPTRLVRLNAGQILTLCEHNPSFGYQFMRRCASAVVKRLNATRLQLIDVFGSVMPSASDEHGAAGGKA